MKAPHFSIIFSITIYAVLLPGCRDAGAPTESDIASLNLKRGNIVSCGPGDTAFGSVGFITTCPDRVKAEFDMGVALLHSFEYDEAEKIFAGIIQTEPACAMAYWGVAMSNYHTLWAPPTPDELLKGSRAIRIAQNLKAGSERERGYIQAVASFYKDHETLDHQARYSRFENAMEQLYKKYPEDPEAAIFYALILTGGAEPTDKSFSKQKKAVDILRHVYQDRPDHPGIIHYIIHSFDNPQLAILALPEARKYAAVAPSSAHAQHMPSHIFTRLGLWQEDVNSNLDAADAARCYGESTGISGHWDEELHALDYLVYAYLQMGDNDAAKKQVDYIGAIKQVWPVNFKVAYTLAAAPARYALENHDWRAAADLELHSGVVNWNHYPWQKAIHVFARTLGQSNSGQTDKAAAGIIELEQLRDNLEVQKDVYKANQVNIQVHAARAWWLYRSGKPADALAMMTRAADMEDSTQKHAVTPGEVLPARELLGDLLLAMNRPGEALVAYEANLAGHPNRFNGLSGAAKAASRAGQSQISKYYKEQLMAIAKNRQSDRSGLNAARLASVAR